MGSANRTVKMFLIAAPPIILVEDKVWVILFPKYYDAKRLNYDPPLIYGSCFTYSLYS